jgi:hypothetical protein
VANAVPSPDGFKITSRRCEPKDFLNLDREIRPKGRAFAGWTPRFSLPFRAFRGDQYDNYVDARPHFSDGMGLHGVWISRLQYRGSAGACRRAFRERGRI